MELLKNRVALITGAARGQGRAHAVRLAAQGAAIVATDIGANIPELDYDLGTMDELEETVRAVEEVGGRAIAVQADVRSQAQLDAAVSAGVERFGGIDICVANAGVVSLAPFWTMSEETWAVVQDIDLAGVWRTAKAVAPHMIERRAGSIVMTASINGLEPAPEIAHYASAKHGVLGLMKTVALELAPYGIRCNAVCPGATDTKMTDNQFFLDKFAGRPGGTRTDLELAGRRYGVLAPTGNLLPEDISTACSGWCPTCPSV
jgi:SDR family mycofactocin-dependent oxidoreductase